MRVTTEKEIGFAMFDELVRLYETNSYPFNRKDAIIPQKIIPADLRKDKKVLACFYFYICIYMRGGIESLQAFNAMIKMWRAHPELFDPQWAQLHSPAAVQPILKKFVGWDSKAASINWVTNSRLLVRFWGANPLNLLKGLRDYDTALLRIRNKLRKHEQKEVGPRHHGFRGFQPKMVSMLIYFYDWEGWLQKRFLYPSPADFHNFRLGLANGALKVEMAHGVTLRASEKLSAPWRALVLEYMRKRKADPLVLSDALWLFSLVMCGNSPMTITKELKPRTEKVRDKKTKALLREVPLVGLFEHSNVVENWDSTTWAANKSKRLKQTCLACVLSKTCSMAIPSQPYYRKGKLVLRPRPRVERNFTKILPPPSSRETIIEPEVLKLLPLENPTPAS